MEELLESILAFIAKLQADPDALDEFVNADEAAATAILAQNNIEIDANDVDTIMPVLLELISVKTEVETEVEDSYNTEVEIDESFNTDNSDNSVNDSFKISDSYNPWSAQQSLVDSPISTSAGSGAGAGASLLGGGGTPVEIMQSVVNNYVLNLNQSPVIQLWSGDPEAEANELTPFGGHGGGSGQQVNLTFDNNIVMGDNNAFAAQGGEAYVVQTGENHVGHVAVDGDVDDRDIHAGGDVAAYGGEIQNVDASGNSGNVAFNGGEVDNSIDIEAAQGAQVAGNDAIKIEDSYNDESDNSVDNSLSADDGAQLAAGDAVKIEAENGSQVGDNSIDVAIEVELEDSFTSTSENTAVNSFNEDETAIVGPNLAGDGIEDNEAEVD